MCKIFFKCEIVSYLSFCDEFKNSLMLIFILIKKAIFSTNLSRLRVFF